jgi:hypothetical protein
MWAVKDFIVKYKNNIKNLGGVYLIYFINKCHLVFFGKVYVDLLNDFFIRYICIKTVSGTQLEITMLESISQGELGQLQVGS